MRFIALQPRGAGLPRLKSVFPPCVPDHWNANSLAESARDYVIDKDLQMLTLVLDTLVAASHPQAGKLIVTHRPNRTDRPGNLEKAIVIGAASGSRGSIVTTGRTKSLSVPK